MSLGAATLADIYDPIERGTMMGIYYRSVCAGDKAENRVFTIT